MSDNKENLHLSDYTELMRDWDSALNPGIDPSTVTKGSHIMITWRCHKCGRIWSAQAKNRMRGNGCTCDANERKKETVRKANIAKKGSLADNRPDLASQWHPTKNGKLSPSDVLATSPDKVWWKDQGGHEWIQAINVRNRSNTPADVPQGHVIIGFNDFATKHPDVASQWHPTKNGTLKPQNFLSSSGTRVWWLCEKGHEWPASIAARSNGRGCPICNQERSTSFPEQTLYFYIKKIFPEAENRYLLEGRLELDIYLPNQQIGIEYDGSYYHSSQRKKKIDSAKNERVHELGIHLVRITDQEGKVPENTEYSVKCYVRNNTADGLNKMVTDTLAVISSLTGQSYSVTPDVDNDRVKILEQYIQGEKANSIAAKAPEVLDEWDWEKNGFLRPEYIQIGSNKKVWWKCKKCGYEWQSPVVNRVRGNKCPVCTHNAIAPGINDLATTNPELLEEWDYGKNSISPQQVTTMSSKLVWWKCKKCGYSWQSSVANKSRGRSCPACDGKVVTATKSLLAVYPALAAEWDQERNKELTAADVLPQSDKKVWWKCKNGHEWQATVSSRSGGNGCPYCGNKIVLKGYNDLATVHPELLPEWDRTNPLMPDEVLPGSDKVVKWICSKGHHWEASIAHRVHGTGCPYCSNRVISKGENDLKTKYPNLATEWNYEKNCDLLPDNVTPGSNRKVWWKCKKGHEWQAIINSRVKGRDCPYCAGVKPIKGTNDLATLRPDLMEEWDFDKNGSIDPTDMMPGSRAIVWWKCKKCGHKWQATIGSRSQGRGCPKCAHKG